MAIPEQIKKLPLGVRCTYNARLVRATRESGRWHWKRQWRGIDLDIAVPCVYIGWRTLSNGTTNHDEDGHTYAPDYHFDAALVVYDPRCKPVFVPFDALTVVDLPDHNPVVFSISGSEP